MRDRRHVYTTVVGVAVGALLTGLLLPFTVGDRATDVRAGDALDARGDRTVVESPLAGETTVPAGERPADEAPDAAGSAGTTSGAPGAAAGDTPAAGPGGPATASGSTSGSALGATDVGVTAETIKLGFLLLDVGSLGSIGIAVPGVDPEQQRAAIEGYLRDINERGGIHGRRVVGAYRGFDVFSHDSMRAACLHLVEDEKVFAVAAAGGFNGPPILCVTEEHGRPFLNNGSVGTPSSYVERSRGLLFALYQASDRMMANWAHELDRLGELDGKQIGILTGEQFDPGGNVVDGALLPAIERLGHEVVHVSRLSEDPSTGSSQVPVEVQQMRSKGVDYVFLVVSTLYGTQFVQTADGQGYHPDYTISDWGSIANDTSNQNMPDSYDGTTVITEYRTGEERVGVPETAIQRECREIYTRETGQELERGANDYGLTQSWCQQVRVFDLALRRAGPDLTPGSFTAGMHQVGEFPMTMWFAGSYAPGKFGAADYVRTARWQSDCRCIIPVDDWRRTRF